MNSASPAPDSSHRAARPARGGPPVAPDASAAGRRTGAAGRSAGRGRRTGSRGGPQRDAGDTAHERWPPWALRAGAPDSSVRLAAAPAQPVSVTAITARTTRPHFSTVSKSKVSKWKSKAKKKGSFFKKLGIVLIVLFVLFLALVIVAIWLLVRFFRRSRNRRSAQ